MELYENQLVKIYIKGDIKQFSITNDYNYETLGFNDDGISVIKMMNNNNSDNIDKKLISNNDIKCVGSNEPVVVKIDPVNGKKYVYMNGKRCGELMPVLPQHKQQSKITTTTNTTSTTATTSRIMNLKLDTKGLKVLRIKRQLPPSPQLPTLRTVPTLQIDDKMKTLYNFKRSQATITDHIKYVDKIQQTDLNLNQFMVVMVNNNINNKPIKKNDIGVQTSLNDTFLNEHYINMLINDDEFLQMDPFSDTKPIIKKNLIDPNKPKTQEEIAKLNFFNDINRALIYDRSGNLPIHDSVMQNDAKLVKKNCLILHARKESINICNSQNYTPLHLAILHNVSDDVLLILLKYKADISLTDNDGNTALHLAVEHKRINLLKILLDYTVHVRFNLNTFNYDGLTPLILSCCNRSYEITKLLLDKGADPNVRDMKSGRTALFHAAEAYDLNIVQLLISYKADTKVRNFVGTSPHDAMFELDDVPGRIKSLILGKEHIRLQSKRKLEQQKNNGGSTSSNNNSNKPVTREKHYQLKKTKMEFTPVLQKVEPKFQAVLDRVQFKNKC